MFPEGSTSPAEPSGSHGGHAPSTRSAAVLVVVLFLAAVVPRLYHVRSRFMSFADHNTSNFSIFARNLLDHGWIATRLGQVSDPWVADSGRLTYFAHHPPGTALLASISFWLFGLSEPAARLLPLLASAATCPVIFLVGRRILPAWGAILAAIVFAFAPGAVYYGQMLCPEAFVSLFGWLCALAWCRFAESGNSGWWFASLALLSAAVLFDWQGVYLAAGLSIATALCPATRPRWIRLTAQAAMAGCGTAVLAGLHILYLMGSPSDITAALSRRVLSTPDVRFMWAEYLLREWDSLGYALTPPWRAMTGLGASAALVSLLVYAALRSRRPGGSASGTGAVPPASPASVIAALGVGHHLIFTNAVFLNDNLVYYLLPPAAVLCAAGPVLLARGIGRIAGRKVAAVAGLTVAIAFVGTAAVNVPAGIRARMTDPVYPGWPLLGMALNEIVPENARILTPGVMTNPQFRFYLWRLVASGKDQAGKLRALGPEVFFLWELNRAIAPDLEAVLSRSPCTALLSLSLCDLRRGSSAPDVPELEAPEGDYDMVDAIFQDKAALRLVSLSRRAVPPVPGRLVDVYLGVPWTPSTAGSRIVHASFVWERLDGAAGSLIPEYRLALRGSDPWRMVPLMWHTRSSAFDLAGSAPGGTVRHEIDWMLAEWLDPGKYELRVLLREGSQLVRAEQPEGSGRTDVFAAAGTVEIASAGSVD